MSTPAERAEGLAALTAAVKAATEYLTQVQLPADVDLRLANVEDDLATLVKRVDAIDRSPPGRR